LVSVGQGAEHRVTEAGDDSPGAEQDGDVADQAPGLVGEDGYPADLAVVDEAFPDDAGGLAEEAEREVPAVQVLCEDRGVEGHVLCEEGRDLSGVAAFRSTGETMCHHDGFPY
jgi:hypothetical protein